MNSNNKQYFIQIDGNIKGPYTYTQLCNMNIPRGILVWYDGIKEWEKIENVQEFQMIMSHLPPSAAPNKTIKIELVLPKNKFFRFRLTKFKKELPTRLSKGILFILKLGLKIAFVYLIIGLLIFSIKYFIGYSPMEIKKRYQLEKEEYQLTYFELTSFIKKRDSLTAIALKNPNSAYYKAIQDQNKIIMENKITQEKKKEETARMLFEYLKKNRLNTNDDIRYNSEKVITNERTISQIINNDSKYKLAPVPILSIKLLEGLNDHDFVIQEKLDSVILIFFGSNIKRTSFKYDEFYEQNMIKKLEDLIKYSDKLEKEELKYHFEKSYYYTEDLLIKIIIVSMSLIILFIIGKWIIINSKNQL